MSPSRLIAVARLSALFVLYACCTIWLTWPLGAAPSERLACTDPSCGFDVLYSAWAMAWQSHAVVTSNAHVADANIFWPARDALYYGPAGFGAAPYFAPTFLLSGSAALATNVMLLVCSALSALSVHWVVERWTAMPAAGFVGAATLLFQPWYLWGQVADTPHLAPVQYFALIIWLVAQKSRSLGQAALLAAMIVTQCLTDIVYVAGAVVAPVGLIALGRCLRAETRRDGVRLAITLAVALAGLLPFMLGYLRVRAANPLLAEQTLWQAPTAEDLRATDWSSDILLRYGWSDLTGLFWRSAVPTTVAPPALVLVVVGAALAIRRRSATRVALAHDPGWLHAGIWLLAGTFISLTPVAKAGSHAIYLPQYLLAVTLRLYETIRAPGRLGVAAMIAACILSGIGFAEITHALVGNASRTILRRTVHGLLAACALLALYFVPSPGTNVAAAVYPTRGVPTIPPSFAPALAAADGPLLHVPVFAPGKRSWPSSNWNANAMYLSTYHWQPLLNGYSSYWPTGFIRRMQLAEDLPDPLAMTRLVRVTGLRTVWVHLYGLQPEQRTKWRAAERGRIRGLALVASDRGDLLFRVDPTVYEAPVGQSVTPQGELP